ncbi:MAG: 50S ribosomal protein L6 [Candidatus Diapherotrites archaeon]
MKEEVEVLENVKVLVEGGKVKAEGSGAKAERAIPSQVKAEMKEGKLVLESKDETKTSKRELNTFAAHCRNMVKGCNKFFEYKMQVVYSHFPMTVAKKGNDIEVNNFLGSKKPRLAKIVGSTQVEIKGKDITIKGHDKEAVGQTAANIERVAKVKGKDPRIYQDGIYLVEKGEA